MLNDRDRKILRIVNNILLKRKYPPSIQEIANKTGRSPGEVQAGLRTLAEKGFIEWSADQPQRMQMIKAWENHQNLQPQKPNQERNSQNFWDMESF